MSTFGVEGSKVVTAHGAIETDEEMLREATCLISGNYNGALVLIATDCVAIEGAVSSVERHKMSVTVELDPVRRVVEKAADGRWRETHPPLIARVTFEMGDIGTKARVCTGACIKAYLLTLYP